jgi:VanZ family protein
MITMKINTVLWVLWTLALLAILLLPIRDSLIPNYRGFRHWDKVAHFGLFAVTGFMNIYGAGFFSSYRYRFIFGLVFGLTLAVGTELGQTLIPFRSTSLYDLLADLAGLCLGVLTYVLLYSRERIRSSLRL